jgi:hypothetical protein
MAQLLLSNMLNDRYVKIENYLKVREQLIQIGCWFPEYYSMMFQVLPGPSVAFHDFPYGSVGFHRICMNRNVSTKNNRGLTSYRMNVYEFICCVIVYYTLITNCESKIREGWTLQRMRWSVGLLDIM